MRAVRLTAVVFLVACCAAGAEIRSYQVRIESASDGPARGTAALAIVDAGPAIAIPLGFTAHDVRLTAAPAGTRVSSAPFNGQTRVVLQLQQPVPRELAVDLAFVVESALTTPEPAAGQKRVLPEGNMLAVQRLVNSEPAPILRYTCEFVFPDGMRAHAIREALPKLGKKEATPRVQLVPFGSHAGARMQTGMLRQGDAASMQIELVPQKRSPTWLIAGVVLSLAYLVYFRDLVGKGAGSAPPAGPSPGEVK